MALRSIELINFRSYAAARFEFDPQITVVVGPNASGKTNLLEAVYVLSVTRSFRAKDRELVRHGQDFFRLVGVADEQEYAFGLRTRPGLEKRASHNGAKRSLVEHVGRLPVTLFEPSDLELVSGPPDVRRRYLDGILSQTDGQYRRTLLLYRRVLQQRNALLEGFAIDDVRGQIFSWDVKLTELAGQIVERRLTLLDYLNDRLPKLYGEIAGTVVPVRLIYQPTIGESGNYADRFLSALTANLVRDLGAGFTTIGPHREDFRTDFDDVPISNVASRGETRTVVLALKLAELDYGREQTGRTPLLLLDDVFSELDRDRRHFLLRRLGDGQTIITTTDAEVIRQDLPGSHRLIETLAASKGGGDA